MTLTKDALVNEVAKANGYPRNRSVELIETLLELIKSKARFRGGCSDQRFREILR